ncbi:MAG: ATP-binding protein [Herpetosiphonaceae bacterium]|nr:ATP-binding protein [Herpetosiphonaceae bacterium]
MQLLPTTQLPPHELLALLERHMLDVQPVPPQGIYGQVDAAAWWQVEGIARFWEGQEQGVLVRCMEDLLTGLHAGGATPMLLLHTFGGELQVFVGVQAEYAPVLEGALQGNFAGILLAAVPQRLGSALSKQSAFAHTGQLTGIPTCKAAPAERQQAPSGQAAHLQQIERLIRGMGREQWGYFVRGIPVPPAEVLLLGSQVIELIKAYGNQAHTVHEIRPGVSIQGDWTAQHCVMVLERLLQRVERGKAQGMWQSESTFFASDILTLGQVAGFLRGIFAGPEGQPDPIRSRIHTPGAPPVALEDRQTVLHTGELATLMQLPSEEMPGYHVHQYVRFDVALPPTNPAVHNIALGAVLDVTRATGQHYSLVRDDLTKHGLVVGVTGSGKTNTCFGLLERVWEGGRGQPFLVIEPAKAEYRSLLRPLRNQLRVYTLGDERYAPFRLNPFEFECHDVEQRIHVQTHIDYLKSVFGAAFVLYPPMPYVLETCLHEVYADRGWNLTTSAIERRLPRPQRGQEARYPVFPTLQDLYDKIDPVVDRLGYDAQIQRDVKAGLKARIGSLLLGGKGLMLNTRRSVPFGALLQFPTVLELERIGDDDEKAFVIGLLLTRLYEYRVIEGRRQAAPSEAVRHLLLIEEAHRLLQNVSTAQESEAANPRGKAVESFANMLAEIRAYGQGVLIAEQIPSKLTPDAIKNTNLKILHRTVAADEREVMAGAMNLSDAQKQAVTTLLTGQAVVFAEGADRPYLVQIERAKGSGGWAATKPNDAEVRQAMIDLGAFDDEIYKPRPGCERCGLWKRDPVRCATIRHLALTVQEQPVFTEAFRRYTLSLSQDGERAVLGYRDLLQPLRQAVQPGDDQEEREVALCAVVHRSATDMERLGEYYDLPYGTLVELHTGKLLPVLALVTKNFSNDQAAVVQLTQHVAPKAKEYGQALDMATARRDGPFASCIFCRQRCRYGWDLAPLAQNGRLQRDIIQAIETIADAQQMWAKVAEISQHAANRALVGTTPQPVAAAALCFAAQTSAALGFADDTQRKMTGQVRDALKP